MKPHALLAILSILVPTGPIIGAAQETPAGQAARYSKQPACVVVHLGCGDGSLTAALCRNER